MTRACHLAVRMATGQAFSDDEIDDMLNRMEDRAKRARRAAPGLDAKASLAQAASELTKEQLMSAMIQQRLEVAAEIARTARRARIDAMPATMTAAQRLDAYNVGSERQGLGTSSSVDAEGRARQMGLWGDVERGLNEQTGLIDRLSNWAGFAEKGFARKVAREMARLNGAGDVEPTGDEGALHAARVLAKALEDVRQMQNGVGAWITNQEGYIARQTHDPLKVEGGMNRELGEIARRLPADGLKSFDWAAARSAAERRAFATWRDFIMPKLDPKTFDGLEMEDVHWTKWEDEAEEKRQMGRKAALAVAQNLAARGVLKDGSDLRELFLYHVWADIVTGRHAEISGMSDLGDFRPPGGTAAAVSKARVLHFNSPDAWMDYNEKYGRGGLLNTVLSQLERGARNTALMQRWGPNPEAAFEAERARLANEAVNHGDVDAANKLNGTMTLARFEQLNGRAEIPDNLRFATVMRTLRAYEGLTKLGSIVLSKTSDLPLSSQTMARAGAGFLRGYEGNFKGVMRLGGEDAKRAADALAVSARSFAGHLGGQFSATDGTRGWIAWAQRLQYKVNLFEYLNNGVRGVAAETYSRHLGQEAERGWDRLNAGTRETFERFGIQPADWEIARQGLQPAPDGRTYFTLDHFDAKVAETQAKVAELLKKTAPKDQADVRAQAAQRQASLAEMRLRFSTMIHNVIDDAVSEPRAREHANMSHGTRPGTVWGEIARTFWQFKGFVNTIVGRQLVPASRGYAQLSPVALMAHLIIGTALAGYIGMNAKAISRGEAPRPLIGSSVADTAKIWGASLAQGGGLGIYGDFLFGELNRSGAAWSVAQMGGPLLSDFEQAGTIVQQAVHGGAISASTGRSAIPGETVRLGSQNIPLINLWYTRLALDYLVLWRLQEATSPGYLERREQEGRRSGTKYIVSPTSAVAH